jgi:UDP-N-acetylglucosamine 1-carboxyvinyltransferase
MAAVAAAGGDVLVNNVIPKHLDSIIAKLEEMGVEIEEFDEAVRVRRTKPLRRCNIKTMPHPGFPTDMQPQFGVLLAIANGTSILTEGVWDNRFRYIEELRRMGVQASVDGKIAVFEGVPELSGANVRSTDLRAGAALIIAGLVAKGETQIDSIVYIDRGYENVVEKFTGIGADIERREFPDEAVAVKAN